MSMTLIIVLIAALAIVLMLLVLLGGSSNHKGKTQNVIYKYQKRSLLTNNELAFYKVLFQIATKKSLIPLTKVRLADLIEPKGTDNTQASRNKTSQKHVDFVLCDSAKVSPVLVIELDDKTHDRADRQQRDSFVDQALESAGIPILHTRTTDKLEENIIKKLSSKSPSLK